MQQARQHRVPNRLRHGVLRRGQQFPHEERIARGHVVNLAGIMLGAMGKLFDGGERKRRHAQTRRMPSGQVPENAAQQIRRGKLFVAVSPDHQAARALDAAAHEANKIERRLIGPMQVLQHHNADRIWRRDALEQT